MFRRVITAYIDAKESGNRGGQLGATTGGVVRMCASDLICDVEKIARKTLLNEYHYDFFVRAYTNQEPNFEANHVAQWTQADHDVMKHDIQTKLGRRFEAAGIFPVGQYMKPRDVRRAK